MDIGQDLLARLAQEYLGHGQVDPDVLADVAGRLAGLLARLRAASEEALQAVPPPIAFVPDHPAWFQVPAPSPPPWMGMAAGVGGTGYGGPAGTTGVGAAPPPPPAPAAAGGPEFLWWSAADLVAAIRRRDLSPVEVVRAALDRIAALNPVLNAFVTVTVEAALAEARAAEAAALRGEWAGPLHGVPVAVKDVIATAGVRTTAGSRILAGHVPDQDATCVARLRAAGAIVVGKAATHEFAFGPTTDSPFLGPTRNPWRLQHVPGGSSGGSGAAVAAGLVPLALGTDTGGSIRMPAAACGTFGLKPTYGRVSKAGVLPLSWSLDHVGPLCRSPEDAALALAALAGPDPLDPAALPLPAPDLAPAVAQATAGLAGLRLGVPARWLEEGPVDGDVLRLFHAAVATLRDLGAQVVEVDLPPAAVMTLVNRVITLAEASAFHAPWLASRAGDYAPDVRARLEVGQFLLARDYLTAQRLRTDLCRRVARAMQGVDALLTPTMPIPAPRIGQGLWDYGGAQEAVQEAMIRFTAPFSVTGQPAASVPCGLTPGGLPVGLQVVGRPLDEATVLRVAAAYRQAAGDLNRPPLVP